MFVVVEVRLAATENRAVSLTSPQLLTRDGRDVRCPYNSSLLKAVSGFRTTNDVVFEVDPRHIDDLTLLLWESEVVFQYQQRARIHLGITPANAEQWRQAGARPERRTPPLRGHRGPAMTMPSLTSAWAGRRRAWWLAGCAALMVLTYLLGWTAYAANGLVILGRLQQLATGGAGDPARR